MQVQRILWLLLLGVAYASGNLCDSIHAASCYADLVHYESLAFPLYGQDEVKLDETCENINISFECLESYTETCHESQECDEECRDLIRDAEAFSRSTGIRKLADELCSEYSAVRAIYLENYDCLEANADAFAACHNDSQKSQEYLHSITGEQVIPSRCCFFSWYHDCFTNVTRDHCGTNATFFVSFAMHKLVGHIADQLCVPTDASCKRPPLPPDDAEDLDKDKPDETYNDIDNSINDLSKSSTTVTSYMVDMMVLSYCFIVLSKRFL